MLYLDSNQNPVQLVDDYVRCLLLDNVLTSDEGYACLLT